MIRKSLWKLEAFATHLRRGRWALLLNDFLRLFGLGRFVHVGESLFLTIPSLRSRNENFEREPEEEFPFQLTARTDEALIPQLLACIEGSRDYAYLSDREIEERFRQLLDGGNTAWVVRDGDRVAGFFWTTTGEYLVPCGKRRILLQLPDDVAFVEFIFVHPDYRRHGVYSRAFNRVARLRDGTTFSCVVDSYNDASTAAHRKLGFRQNGVLRYVRFFGCQGSTFRLGKTRRRFFCPKKDEPDAIRVEY